MPIKLDRIFQHPILEPVKEHAWEAAAVFNCAAVYHENHYHLVYRATDIDASGKDGPFISSLGTAINTDGFHLKELNFPC